MTRPEHFLAIAIALGSGAWAQTAAPEIPYEAARFALRSAM